MLQKVKYSRDLLAIDKVGQWLVAMPICHIDNDDDDDNRTAN